MSKTPNAGPGPDNHVDLPLSTTLPVKGERMDFTNDIATIQEHICRYAWAMKHCVGKLVLDAGCGTGYGARLLATVAKQVVAVDVSAEAVAAARDQWHAPNMRWYECAIENLSAQDPFETVVCLEALEHLDDMEAGLAKLLELLAPQGTLVLSVPVQQGANPWHHGRDWTISEWDEFLLGRGLQTVCFYQPRGGAADEMSNCHIRYRISAPPVVAGYSLYVMRRRG